MPATLLCSLSKAEEAVELVLKQSDAASATALVREARSRWLERAAWTDECLLKSWSRGCQGKVNV